MNKIKLIIAGIICVFLIRCAADDNPVDVQQADQIQIRLLKYLPGDSPGFIFNIDNNSQNDIISRNHFLYQTQQDSNWLDYDMSPFQGNNQPLTLHMPAYKSQELFVDLFPPLDFTWRLGILFHRDVPADSVLSWSDSIRIMLKTNQ